MFAYFSSGIRSVLIMIVFAIAAFLVVQPTPARAQSLDVSSMLERMQTIMSEMAALQKEFATLQTALKDSTPTPTVLGESTTAAASVFTQPLEYGETNSDIERIQNLLATDPEIYDHPYVTGFFGQKTEEAITRLQSRFGLDPVGVIGPATTKLLEGYFRAYPGGNYPDGVLSTKPPAVLGVSNTAGNGAATTLTALQKQLAALQGTGSGSPSAPSGNLDVINVTFDGRESLIEILFADGKRSGLIADTTDRDEVIAFVADELGETELTIRSVILFSKDSNDSDQSEDDAADALDDAEEEIEDAEAEIEAAEEDGDDTDWAEDTLDEADDALDEAETAYEDEDWDEAVKLAKKAEKLAKQAVDRIDEEEDDRGSRNDDDEIDEIVVEIDDGESEVVVEYENGEEYEFTVDEDDEEDIITAIADELDIDEDEVEDLIEFDYGSLDYIVVRINEDDGTALARVFYDSGVERRVRMNVTDESEIIEAIADAIDEDEENIEKWAEFD